MQLAQYIIYGLKDFEYGLMQLDVILDIDPGYEDALLARVAVTSKYKKYNDETNEKFLKIIEFKQTGDIYNAYARFLRNQMLDFKKSQEYYEKAIALEPNRYEFHQNYAALLLNDIKDYGKAKEELEALMKLKPGDRKVKDNYDRLIREKFDKNGNPKKARLRFLRR